MKIRKLCTYENLQLQNEDGSKPRGPWTRLSKTFDSQYFDMRFAPSGIDGVLLKGKEDDDMSTFFIPFANIPYAIVDKEDKLVTSAFEDSGSSNDAKVVRRRRRTKSEMDTARSQKLQTSESRASSTGTSQQKLIPKGIFERTDSDGREGPQHKSFRGENRSELPDDSEMEE